MVTVEISWIELFESVELCSGDSLEMADNLAVTQGRILHGHLFRSSRHKAL